MEEALVEVEDTGILHDADTPEDFRQLLELHNSQLVRPVLQVSVARQLTFLDGRVAMLLRLIGEDGLRARGLPEDADELFLGMERHQDAGKMNWDSRS